MAVKSGGDGEDGAFWRTTPLETMSDAQWESLCDGCGRCCLNKLEDWDTGAIAWTDIACKLLDHQSCRCKHYPTRADFVPDCISLTPEEVRTLTWLPPTCGYRLVADGHDLPWWHPLVSGDPETVHQAGISVRGQVIDEIGIALEDYEDHLVEWPGEVPPAGISPRRPAPNAAARLKKWRATSRG